MKDLIKGLERGSLVFLSNNPGEFPTEVPCFDVNFPENKAHVQAPDQSFLSHTHVQTLNCHRELADKTRLQL